MTAACKLSALTLGFLTLAACSGLNSTDPEPDTDADTQVFIPDDIDTLGEPDEPDTDTDTDSGTDEPDTDGDTGCDQFGFTTAASQSTGNAAAFLYQAFNTDLVPFDTLVLQVFTEGDGTPITGPGTYTIGAELGDRNLESCSTCVRVLQTCDENVTCEAEYFATSGTITVTEFSAQPAGIAGVITDLELVEVTVDPNTLVSTRVPGGDRWCIDEHVMGTSPTGGTLDPIAVGFGFDGGWSGSEPRDYTFFGQTGPAVIEPIIELTFASQAYFTATTPEELAGTSCTALAGFDVVQGTSILDTGGQPVWTQLDTTVSILRNTWTFEDTSCGFLLDYTQWGDGGQDLLDAFTAFRFGMGVGPMTPDLLAGWQDANGNWLNANIAAAAPSMVGTFTALNDAAGAFVLEDYSTGFAFQIDTNTWVPNTDPSGQFLIYQDLTGVSSLPPTYLRAQPYLFRNFTGLDLTNLGDGRPQ
ncbi:MAG: hypothetical protein ACJAZO_003187 [Myxococcota bacterium]|jgi:hypothetical protein